MEALEAREGDYIETFDGLICDVKGLVHPGDRVVAFPRFVPDPNGERVRNGLCFRKVYPLADRFALLRDRYPEYYRFDRVFGRYMSEIPHEAISRINRPIEKVPELAKRGHLDSAERDALDFALLLSTSPGLGLDAIGISGSVLVGLHTPQSDVDILVYGARNCLLARRRVEELLDEGREVERYSEEGLRRLFEFRSQDTAMSFHDFARLERRKTIEGTFRRRDFFIRHVKAPDEVGEVYGDRTYRPLGRLAVEATITDDSDSIFTPCSYKVSHVRVVEGPEGVSIAEIVSFRGRFCEQAHSGERVAASGTLERVEFIDGGAANRLLLGNAREDFMSVVDS